MPTIVVDCHSHIFNAEDLPIDGFIKKLSPAPSLLTGIVSVPLDRLTAWAAPGSSEGDTLLARLKADPADLAGLEAIEDEAGQGVELISDDELDALLVEQWPAGQAAPETGLEGVVTTEDEIVTRLETASPDQLRDLESWLADWGDPEFDAVIEAERSNLEGLTDWIARARAVRRAVQRYVAALRLVTRHRYRIAADLATTYPDVALFVPALVDFSSTTRDTPSTRVQEQISLHSLVAKVSVAGRIPGAPDTRFHPMVGFCPYREVETTALRFWDVNAGSPNNYVPYADPSSADAEDRYHPGIRFDPARAKALHDPDGSGDTAVLRLEGVTQGLDLVRHAIELGGFAGVKVYPPSGFSPLGNVAKFGEVRGQRLDAALRALYGYCEVMQVPILTHAAHSNGFEDGYNDLAAPSGWELVLAEFPQLRLCFGHFGHLHGVGPDAANPSPTSWSARFVRLIDEYDHVYADVGNSKFAISESYRNRFRPLLTALLGPADTHDATLVKRRRRVMFGSDYWMNTLSPDHDGYLDAFRDHLGGVFDGPSRGWFFGQNALRFLGFTNEQDQPDESLPANQRMRAFYDPHDLPAWLA